MSDLSEATLAAARNVVAMVTALHHEQVDDVVDLFASFTGEERDNTLILLVLHALQGYDRAAQADGISLDEALVTCGLLATGESA